MYIKSFYYRFFSSNQINILGSLVNCLSHMSVLTIVILLFMKSGFGNRIKIMNKTQGYMYLISSKVHCFLPMQMKLNKVIDSFVKIYATNRQHSETLLTIQHLNFVLLCGFSSTVWAFTDTHKYEPLDSNS